MMTIEEIKTQLDERLKITAATEPGQVVSRLDVIGKLLDLIGGWRGLIGHLDKEQVQKAVMDFYRAWVKPLDIPGVPFFFESLVDEAIERLLIAVIDRVFEESAAV